MRRFRIQHFLAASNCNTRYNTPKNDRYSFPTADSTLVTLTFTVGHYGTKLVYDQKDTPHAVMCFVKKQKHGLYTKRIL